MVAVGITWQFGENSFCVKPQSYSLSRTRCSLKHLKVQHSVDHKLLGKSGIKEMLIQLGGAIAKSPELEEEDKAEALEQVKSLAEAGKNQSDEGMKKQAKRGITMLRGIVTGLQPTAALVTICKELLPAIASFFGL